MNDAALLWRVEETCLNAWPALRQVQLAGWVLRFSGGLTRRANSANPLGIERADPDDLIAGCEALYRHRRQPTIFRLPSLIGPEIDERLAVLGYRNEGRSLVLYAELGDMPRRATRRCGCARARQRIGLRRWRCCRASRGRRRRSVAGSSARSRSRRRLPCSATRRGWRRLPWRNPRRRDLLRVGRDRPAPAAPRLCRRIIAALADWAADRGATGACLEVEAANAPACRALRALGFRELYSYHYCGIAARAGQGCGR